MALYTRRWTHERKLRLVRRSGRERASAGKSRLYYVHAFSVWVAVGQRIGHGPQSVSFHDIVEFRNCGNEEEA